MSKTAFVLAGGGTKGAFEAGAIRYLVEEEAITPEVITATSAGSICAVVLAQARTHRELVDRARDLHDDLLAMTDSQLLFGKQPWVAALDGTPFGRAVDGYVTERTRPPIPGTNPPGPEPSRPEPGRTGRGLADFAGAGVASGSPDLGPAAGGPSPVAPVPGHGGAGRPGPPPPEPGPQGAAGQRQLDPHARAAGRGPPARGVERDPAGRPGARRPAGPGAPDGGGGPRRRRPAVRDRARRDRRVGRGHAGGRPGRRAGRDAGIGERPDAVPSPTAGRRRLRGRRHRQQHPGRRGRPSRRHPGLRRPGRPGRPAAGHDGLPVGHRAGCVPAGGGGGRLRRAPAGQPATRRCRRGRR